MTSLTLRPPLHIGARLMPALRVSDNSTTHILPTRRGPDGRVVWRYIIDDHDRHVLDDATDLRSGIGDDIDPNKAMATLVGFLTAAAEAWPLGAMPHVDMSAGSGTPGRPPRAESRLVRWRARVTSVEQSSRLGPGVEPARREHPLRSAADTAEYESLSARLRERDEFSISQTSQRS